MKTLSHPFSVDAVASDTAPARPWMYAWCAECGTASCFSVVTPHGQMCGTCYMARVASGKEPTAPPAEQDSPEDFCDCAACRRRRAQMALRVESYKPNPVCEDTDPACEDAEPLDPTPDVPSEPFMVRLLAEIPDWLRPEEFVFISREIVARLRALTDGCEDADADVLRRLAFQIEEDPLTHLQRDLSEREVAVLDLLGFRFDSPLYVDRDVPLVDPEEGRLLKNVDLADLHPAALEAAKALVSYQGFPFVAKHPDVDVLVGDFAEHVLRPFAVLTGGRADGSTYTLGDFMVGMLGGTLFPSFMSIMAVLYHAVHERERDMLHNDIDHLDHQDDHDS